MKLRDLEKKIIDHELANGASLAEASWTGANVIMAGLDGGLDPETATAYGLTIDEYLTIANFKRR